ncbi:uncharacterized protein LOC126904159 [Daktulosphaira vitifoliae]|uniref:uncharacterized protein LOC126904159 n=1 Tax=Daktulosphaira vitifoliae TaxID=58002 RepID=UPI0021AACE40|nr:uncharacterized protein LOC126904159 [Daktulosphaira vitifoliae]
MFQLILFSSLCIYGSTNLRVTMTYVSVLNTLVQQPGWTQFTTPVNTFTYKGKNFDRIRQEFELSTIFPSDSVPNIIKKENFYDRVWQLHLLLGIHYAIDLKAPIELTLYFWDFCQKKCNDDLKNICLQCLAKSCQIFYKEIRRMKNSLFYFFTIVQLPIQNVYDTLFNRIHVILNCLSDLETLKDLTTSNSFEKSLEITIFAIRSAFEWHTQKINYFCIENPAQPLYASWCENNIPLEEQLKHIQEIYKTNINKLIEINNTYGFKYDPDTLFVINNRIQLYGR